MAGKFELYKDKAGEFRFRLKAGNGEIIGASEGYTTKENALKGIKSVSTNASEEGLYTLKEGKNGKTYFNLKLKTIRLFSVRRAILQGVVRNRGLSR